MIRHLLALMLVLAAAPAAAAIDDGTLPSDTAWYVHVDLETMRATAVGKQIYDWLDGEVFDEVRTETGFDPDTELDRVTAYSDDAGVGTLILEGAITGASRDKLLAALEAGADLATGSANGRNYYEIRNIDTRGADLHIQGDTLFLSFARRNAVVVSSTLDGMQRGLDARPRRNRGKALLVLAADKSLMQAGVDTVALGNGNGPSSWNSGLLREAREVALVLADRGGEADLAVRVTANDPRTTDSLAAVVRGLIGLQALAEDQDPNVTRLLSSVQVDTDSAGMTLALRVAPDVLRAVIEN